MLTHWRKYCNPNYLGSYAFQPNEEKVVTIKDVTREMVTGAEGKTSEETVVHFSQDCKPLILNSTNARMIEKLLKTPYVEQWKGGNVVLVVRQVKAFGDVCDAVRVKPERIGEVCENCRKPIEAAGSMSNREIAAYTRQKFGKVLCAECAKKASGGAKSE